MEKEREREHGQRVISGFGERKREVSRATAAKLAKASEGERQGGRGSPEGTAGRGERRRKKEKKAQNGINSTIFSPADNNDIRFTTLFNSGLFNKVLN